MCRPPKLGEVHPNAFNQDLNALASHHQTFKMVQYG